MKRLTHDDINVLAQKWLKGTLTPSEQEQLNAWYETDGREPIVWTGEDDSEDVLRERLFTAIQDKRGRSRLRIRRGLWPAAAAFLIALSIGVYFYLRESSFDRQQVLQELAIQANRIPAGGNRATLILADGQQIDLNSNQEGIIIQDQQVRYQDGSAIVDSGKLSDEGAYLTLVTPLGGQYQVTLADGTQVWLNAGSSLRYPQHFAGKERRVELQGEAYFEVAKRTDQPFKVVSDGQVVEVLGTHFNISAYTDESRIQTTLLEGAVQVTPVIHTGLSTAPAPIRLMPGQQAQLSTAGIQVLTNLDLESVIAWKNGYFKFNESLESILNKVARWYDVEIVYETQPDPMLTFSGQISRNRPMGGILHMLAFNGDVHFRVEGRRVIVMK